MERNDLYMRLALMKAIAFVCCYHPSFYAISGVIMTKNFVSSSDERNRSLEYLWLCV